jgi:hypothetical protein
MRSTATELEVHLPVSDSMSESRRTATDLFFAVGWQLGEFYDTKLRPVLGERGSRRSPSFVVNFGPSRSTTRSSR